ncbi:hypothetical protein AS850_03920 [Frondihabitans sp. 762G35]|uniref:DUF4307 domain-containing protein n=1 Tax=Frondihabitans sp. 762G35 TaxID=1446794 RepID=UPI000D227EDA|nr:DUF4307 domain-containing protein [Frondihabitans sp. 762G35]ARC56221.1 hypothetical protein AS850_03920 [Frondihabitans sp. 762G35]
MAPTPSRTTGAGGPRPAPGSSDPSAGGPATGDSALDIRYGRTRSFRLRRRWIAAIVGGAFVVVFAAWVVFAGLDGTSATIDTNDAGYVIHSDTSATVTSEVSVNPGTKVDCSIQVLNSSFGVVGWKVVHFPAQTSSTTTYTTELKTTSRGVTGLIDKCWLP